MGMEEELSKCRKQLKELAVDKARLQRNAASAKAEAEAVAGKLTKQCRHCLGLMGRF